MYNTFHTHNTRQTNYAGQPTILPFRVIVKNTTKAHAQSHFQNKPIAFIKKAEVNNYTE